jgi:serine protease
VATAFPAAAPASASRSAASDLTGRVVVLMHRTTGGTHAEASAADAVVASAGLRARAHVPELSMVTVTVPAGETYAEVAARLRANPRVRSVAREHRMQFRSVPNDPALSTPEGATGTPAGTPVQWTLARENLFGAWDITTGAGALVAIIDSGIDGSHPEFAGKIAAAVDQEQVQDTGPATTDTVGHGTHVASLACAATNNGIGIAGAGRDCKLIIEKSDLTDSSIAASIVDATKRGADAINMSFGDDGSRGQSPALVDAINYAYQHGVIVVAAAADAQTAEQGQPANIVQPTGTGADLSQGTGLSVTSADFANAPSGAGFGTQVSLAAYGSFDTFTGSSGPPGLLAAFPANQTSIENGTLLPPSPGCGCRTTFQGDSRYAYLQGTSMSAPQVTAIAAMARHLNPEARPSEILSILKATASRPAGVNAWTQDLGWGIVNAAGAISLVRRVDHRAPTSKLTSPVATTRAGHVTLRWTGADTAPVGLIASGIKSFQLYRSLNGGSARRIATTVRHSRTVALVAGKRNAFFTEAVDKAGNREARPKRADATVRRVR